MNKHFGYSLFLIPITYVEIIAQQTRIILNMYNMNVINPAYAGSKEGILVLLYRKQWINIEDVLPVYFSTAPNR
jgi:hypothetical protein